MIKAIIKKYLFKSTQIDHLSYAVIPKSSSLTNNYNFDFRCKKESRPYVVIGEKCLINASFIFETEKGEVKIGNNVHIGSATFISRNSITVGNDVTMAWDIIIYDHNSHSIYWEERQHDNHQCYEDFINHNGNNVVNKNWTNVKSSPICIKDKVWIGFGVTILKGVTIGEGAVVGAKSVVVCDVEPWTVVGGNPARLLKRLR